MQKINTLALNDWNLSICVKTFFYFKTSLTSHLLWSVCTKHRTDWSFYVCVMYINCAWSFYVCVMYINCAFPSLERFGHSMSVLCILIVPFQLKNGLVILCLCYVYYLCLSNLRTVWSFYVCVMYINCVFLYDFSFEFWICVVFLFSILNTKPYTIYVIIEFSAIVKMIICWYLKVFRYDI